MSEEIRNLLRENPGLSSREVFEELQSRFPGQNINRNSCNVAYSHARRKLGIRPGARRSVKRRRPGVRVAPRGGDGSKLNLALLKSAREFISEAGSAEAAISAIQQLESLQISS